MLTAQQAQEKVQEDACTAKQALHKSKQVGAVKEQFIIYMSLIWL